MHAEVDCMSSIETSIETPLASPSLSFFFHGISQDISNRLGGLKTQTTSVLPWFLMDELGWTRPFSGAGSAAGWLIGNMSNAPLFHSVGSSMSRGACIGK